MRCKANLAIKSKYLISQIVLIKKKTYLSDIYWSSSFLTLQKTHITTEQISFVLQAQKF